MQTFHYYVYASPMPFAALSRRYLHYPASHRKKILHCTCRIEIAPVERASQRNKNSKSKEMEAVITAVW
jgi:hypothetical protein